MDKIFRVAVQATNKKTGKRYLLLFVATGDSGDNAIDKVQNDFDLSGMDIETSVAAEQADWTVCIGQREVI